jgi:hypothetical protein
MRKQMVDEKKIPEVELDLDDVKEQEIQVKEESKAEKKAPSLNVGEVDLGYTTHSKEDKKEKVEIEQEEETKPVETKPVEQAKTTETKTDDLSEISESVQKRIDKLTRRYREAERREQAAVEFAKGLQKKYSDYEKKFDTADNNYLKEFDARVDAQREQVKIKLKAAIEANDPNKIMEANDELTQLAVQKEKAKLQMADREIRAKQLEEQRKLEVEEAKVQKENVVVPKPSEKAKSWATKNTWFGDDKIMTQAAFSIHEELVGSGVEVESDEYYNEIDKRMKGYFPHRFVVEEQRKPVQTVASAGRKQEGRRTVRLTKSQVAIAKKLGVPLEEYAKYVKEAN